jgi:hypothetical protein
VENGSLLAPLSVAFDATQFAGDVFCVGLTKHFRVASTPHWLNVAAFDHVHDAMHGDATLSGDFTNCKQCGSLCHLPFPFCIARSPCAAYSKANKQA